MYNKIKPQNDILVLMYYKTQNMYYFYMNREEDGFLKGIYLSSYNPFLLET